MLAATTFADCCCHSMRHIKTLWRLLHQLEVEKLSQQLERASVFSKGPRCYHRYRWRLLPLCIESARQSDNTQTANATCHLPPATRQSHSGSSTATCNSKSRRAALQQIVRLFAIEARAGCVATSLFGLFRFFLFAVFNLSLEAKVAKLVPRLTRLKPCAIAPRRQLDGMLFARWVCLAWLLVAGVCCFH